MNKKSSSGFTIIEVLIVLAIASTVIPTITDPDKVLTDTYFQCNTNGFDAIVAPTSRYMIVLYAVETNSGYQQQCLESSIYPH